MFPQLARFTAAADKDQTHHQSKREQSEVRHLKNQEARSTSIGMSKSFTMFLGMAELAEPWDLPSAYLRNSLLSG